MAASRRRCRRTALSGYRTPRRAVAIVVPRGRSRRAAATPESRWPLRGRDRPRPRHRPRNAGAVPGRRRRAGPADMARRRGVRKARPVPAPPSPERRGPSLRRKGAGHRGGERRTMNCRRLGPTTRQADAWPRRHWPVTTSVSPNSIFGVNSRCSTLLASIPIVRRRARVRQPGQRVA